MRSRQFSAETKATLTGFVAILMWALLALFTAASGDVPPLQLLAMSFAIGSLCGMMRWVVDPEIPKQSKPSPIVWLFGTAGLFGYHFFYYLALRNAPVAEAGLIAYLWPLLIVLFSALLPGEKLRWFHLAGAATGFAGIAVLIGPSGFGGGNALGYWSAICCAFIWSSYSVGSRFFKSVSTDVVTLYCLSTAILSAVLHVFLEQTVWPQNTMQWLAVIGLGTMPVGIAFYVWDYGVKHGNIQLLGTAAYFAPVLSTLVLVASGYAIADTRLVVACLLVTGGAVIASGRLFGKIDP